MIARWVWVVMLIGTGIEFALGVLCLVLIPVRRPDQWLPPQSKGVYIAHAVLGGLLAIGALAILMPALNGPKFVRLGGQIGLGGGMLSVVHSWRLTGIGLMFAGALVAFFAYVIPLADTSAEEQPG
jgi:hypothetical protein